MTEHRRGHFSLESKLAIFTRDRDREHAFGAGDEWVTVPLSLERFDVRYHPHNAGGRREGVTFCKRLFCLCHPTNAWIDLDFGVPIAAAGERTRRGQQTDKTHRHCHYPNTALRDDHFQYSLFEDGRSAVATFGVTADLSQTLNSNHRAKAKPARCCLN